MAGGGPVRTRATAVPGEPAQGLGEAPGMQRVAEEGLEADSSEALVQVEVVAPGGLEDGVDGTEPEGPLFHGYHRAIVATACKLPRTVRVEGVCFQVPRRLERFHSNWWPQYLRRERLRNRAGIDRSNWPDELQS